MRGGWFLESAFDPNNYALWKKEITGTKNLEKFINHVHIYDLVSEVNGNNEEEVYVLIAKTLQSSWETHLGESLAVVFSNSPEDYRPTLTFFSNQ